MSKWGGASCTRVRRGKRAGQEGQVRNGAGGGWGRGRLEARAAGGGGGGAKKAPGGTLTPLPTTWASAMAALWISAAGWGGAGGPNAEIRNRESTKVFFFVAGQANNVGGRGRPPQSPHCCARPMSCAYTPTLLPWSPWLPATPPTRRHCRHSHFLPLRDSSTSGFFLRVFPTTGPSHASAPPNCPRPLPTP